MLLFDMELDELVHLNVMFSPTGRLLPSEGSLKVGGAMVTVNVHAGVGPYTPQSELDVFDLACQ